MTLPRKNVNNHPDNRSLCNVFSGETSQPFLGLRPCIRPPGVFCFCGGGGESGTFLLNIIIGIQSGTLLGNIWGGGEGGVANFGGRLLHKTGLQEAREMYEFSYCLKQKGFIYHCAHPRPLLVNHCFQIPLPKPLSWLSFLDLCLAESLSPHPTHLLSAWT